MNNEEKEKEKEKIFSVKIEHIEAIHFKCNEGDLEDYVQEYIRNNIKDIEWTYEEATRNKDGTLNHMFGDVPKDLDKLTIKK